MLHRQGDSSICVPSLGWTLNWASCLLAFTMVNVKDLTVALQKKRPLCTGNLATFQIPTMPTASKSNGKPPNALRAFVTTSLDLEKRAWPRSKIHCQRSASGVAIRKISYVPRKAFSQVLSDIYPPISTHKHNVRVS